MRNQYLLIRRLRALLVTRMSKSGHLLQAVTQESRGNCLPPSKGCHGGCIEANELLALTEPYMQPAVRKPVRLPARMPRLQLRRRVTATRQQGLFDEQEAS